MNIQEILRFKPLLVKREDGHEPSIEAIMMHYYTSYGVPTLEASKIVGEYIASIRKEFNV